MCLHVYTNTYWTTYRDRVFCPVLTKSLERTVRRKDAGRAMCASKRHYAWSNARRLIHIGPKPQLTTPSRCDAALVPLNDAEKKYILRWLHSERANAAYSIYTCHKTPFDRVARATAVEKKTTSNRGDHKLSVSVTATAHCDGAAAARRLPLLNMRNYNSYATLHSCASVDEW